MFYGWDRASYSMVGADTSYSMVGTDTSYSMVWTDASYSVVGIYEHRIRSACSNLRNLLLEAVEINY